MTKAKLGTKSEKKGNSYQLAIYRIRVIYIDHLLYDGITFDLMLSTNNTLSQNSHYSSGWIFNLKCPFMTTLYTSIPHSEVSNSPPHIMLFLDRRT